MKTIVIDNFSRGIADDRYNGITGECGFCKHFDILTHPRRLQPLRGMSTDTASTTIGNIIVASNGFLYGVGVDGSNPSNGKLWVRADNNTTASSTGSFGASSTWRALTNNQLSGATVNYDLIVENPDAGQVRTLYWASNNLIVASDPLGASSASTDALTFSSIGQGILHPKDKTIYFPYKTSSAHYIALIAPNATAFGGKNYTAFTLPFLYRCYCLSYYGNYLAIPMTSVNGIGVNGSVVALWNRDTSTTTLDETIPWGAGKLQVLNNLNGVLVGVNTLSAAYSGSFQDYDAIQIKMWAGGAEPTLLKELKAIHLAGSNQPTVTINPRVNFIYNNRLYFSVNVNPNDGKQAAWYGLWSVGKNKLTGEWTVSMERVETNSNTGTGVIAAAISGDFVSMAHTAEGTLTYTSNGVTSSSTYGATSVYESLVNPGMDPADKMRKKKLYAIQVNCLPLPSSASLVLKYRIDSDGDSSDWVTLKTYSTTDGSSFDVPNIPSSGKSDGYNIELRLESTGGAVPIAFAYKYDVLSSNTL